MSQARGDGDRVERLADGLYEAAANPEYWTKALDDLSDSLGGASFVLSLLDHGRLAFGCTHRLDPDHDRLLRAAYARPGSNPLVAAMPRLPIGRAIPRRQVLEQEAYDRSALYNDVFRPLGLRHAAVACLGRERGVIMPCGILRSAEEELDGDQAKLFDAIVPHLRRAVEFSVKLRASEAARKRAEAAADAVADALFVVDALGTILFVNLAGSGELARQEVISGKGGRLSLHRESCHRLLMKLIADAAGGRSMRGGSFILGEIGSNEARAVSVTPASFGTVRPDGDGDALVCLTHLGLARAPGVARLQELFRMTAAEAALAGDLARGLSPEEVAELRHVRISTVRSQIRSIFDETGQHRLIDLMRLLARLA